MSEPLLPLARRYQRGENSRGTMYWLLCGLLAARQLETANDTARQAVRLYPDDPEILTLAGLAAYFSGNAHEAERLLESALEKDPDYSVAALNLGVIMIGQGNTSAAKTFLNRVTDQEPGTPLAERAEWLSDNELR